MNAALRSASPTLPKAGMLATGTPRDLPMIHRPDCNLVLWQRPTDDRIHRLIAQAVGDIPGIKAKLTLDNLSNTLESRLGDSEGMRWLARDVMALARHFSRIANHDHLDICLGPVTRQECPNYHVDNVDLRLLCTYFGAGTEFLDETQVDRDWLGRGRNDRVFRGHRPHQAPPMAVLLIKGAAYPGQPEVGQVHRSPLPLGEQPVRLRLRIDVVREH